MSTMTKNAQEQARSRARRNQAGKGLLQAWVDAELKAAVKARSEREGRDIQDLVSEALRSHLGVAS